jgi:putative ABC transport system substrate-binding protein
MRRREFLQLTSGAAIAWPLPALAQQGTNPPLVAVLSSLSEQVVTTRAGQIREGLKQAGLIEGKDYAMTVRFANGDNARLPDLINELDALKPRVYVTVATGIIQLHKQLPNAAAVFTGIAVDPVALGWVESYARPGGMITGNVQNAVGGVEGVLPKQIGFFKELVPNLTRLGMIYIADELTIPRELNAAQKASEQLGFAFSKCPMPTPDDLASAIASGQSDNVSAFYVSGDPRLAARIPQVVAALAKAGKPACGPYPNWSRGGLLMSYSVDVDDQARRAGVQAAKILRGAKPGDLPIEQADRFVLVINLKTAKQLGITVPPTLLAQADEVIE